MAQIFHPSTNTISRVSIFGAVFLLAVLLFPAPRRLLGGERRAGRRVEVTSGRGIVEVAEVTRTGEPVRTARFMASRVVALVEHPASEDASKRTVSADRPEP